MAGLLDSLIGAVSPAAAERRARARARLSAMERAQRIYDGATQGRRGASFKRKATDQNAETRGQLSRLREGSRDLVRNNAFAARGVQAIANNAIGGGIIPQARAQDDRTRQRAEALMIAHFDTTAIDADGLHDLYGLEALAVRTMVESGEVLIRKRRRFDRDMLPLPFQIQVLEPDYLDTLRDGPVQGGGQMIQGIEFDAIGRRVAYWLFPEHPGALNSGIVRGMTSRRVPASEVAHIFRVDRPGQARGVPWLAPVMLRLRDFADYEDAQLMRQKIAACFAAFISPGGGDLPDAPTTTPDSADADWQETFEPGLIRYLGPGEEIKFTDPPDVGGYKEYSTSQLRAIASGLGITYESLTGDLAGVNFSSGRMGWLEMSRNIDVWRQHIVIPQMLRRVEQWFSEAAMAAGELGEVVPMTWTPPRREMIDPTREVPAMVNAIRGGLTTLSETVRERGFDPAQHFAEYADDLATLDRLGIVVDSDARQVSRAGVTNARPPGTEIPAGTEADSEQE